MTTNTKRANLDLAEIIGIMMGDGGIYFDRNGKYQTNVAFNKEETQYLHYAKKLFEKYFYPYKFCVSELKNEFLNNTIQLITPFEIYSKNRSVNLDLKCLLCDDRFSTSSPRYKRAINIHKTRCSFRKINKK